MPTSAVLLALFFAGAATHMTVFQVNRRRGHFFIFSVLVFGFCMARIMGLVMRIAWACNPTNIDLAIAAQVFTNAGVLVLFIVNVFLLVRIVRGEAPKVGWSRPVWVALRALVVSIIAMLVMVVTCSVHSMFTLNMETRQKERKVLLFAGVYMSVIAFLPMLVIPILLLLKTIAKKNIDLGEREDFGTPDVAGRIRTKITLLFVASVLLTIGAGFRVGVNFATRPAFNPAWWHHKAAFYCFSFALELPVVYMYALFRFDKLFWVPDKSSKPGDFSRGVVAADDCDQEDELLEEGGKSGNSGATSTREKENGGKSDAQAV